MEGNKKKIRGIKNREEVWNYDNEHNIMGSLEVKVNECLSFQHRPSPQLACQ